MRMMDIIEKKRDAGTLSPEEIAFFVHGVTKGEIPDYQTSALLMAIFFRGMNPAETACLTSEMARSGDQVDLSGCGGMTVDKHSTGGVGDKTTLIVAPVAAALGCKVAKMSGRGLGHTGGTIDKLESIPGFRTNIAPEEMLDQVRRIGLCVAGQSGNLAPADKKLYALRDVTATVDQQSLIAASVMSKKLAAGAQAIVLDVKTGRGAFMKTRAESEALAREMVAIGRAAGRRMAALITNMDAPLGRAVGNALEVAEAVRTLRLEGPKDLTSVCVALASHMVRLCTNRPYEACETDVRRVLGNGQALAKLREMVEAQGGDPACIDHPDRLPKAAHTVPVTAWRDGYLTAVDSRGVGEASCILGAGRERMDDAIAPGAGIVFAKSLGEAVRRGDLIATLHFDEEDRLAEGRERLTAAIAIGDAAPPAQPLIYSVIDDAQE